MNTRDSDTPDRRAIRLALNAAVCQAYSRMLTGKYRPKPADEPIRQLTYDDACVDMAASVICGARAGASRAGVVIAMLDDLADRHASRADRRMALGHDDLEAVVEAALAKLYKDPPK